MNINDIPKRTIFFEFYNEKGEILGIIDSKAVKFFGPNFKNASIKFETISTTDRFDNLVQKEVKTPHKKIMIEKNNNNNNNIINDDDDDHLINKDKNSTHSLRPYNGKHSDFAKCSYCLVIFEKKDLILLESSDIPPKRYFYCQDHIAQNLEEDK